MSVLIRGVEMPDRCFACPMCDTDCCGVSKGSYIEYREVDVDIAIDHRPDWCPLVPVPPHGDLISREWLVDVALHLMNTAKNDDIANGVKWLLQYIIESTTIIPADGKDTNVPTKTAEEVDE